MVYAFYGPARFEQASSGIREGPARHKEVALVEIPRGSRIWSKQIYRNYGLEISSLPYAAECEKILDFLRSNENCQVDIPVLAE